MNTVQILGNLTRDPQIRATKTGKAVASLSVAVNRNYTLPTGEQKQYTDYINVIAWGTLAEAVGNYLQKGKRVFVEGRYTTRSYETSEGQKRYITEVTANIIALPLGQSAPKEQESHSTAGAPSGNFGAFGKAMTDEEIPF